MPVEPEPQPPFTLAKPSPLTWLIIEEQTTKPMIGQGPMVEAPRGFIVKKLLRLAVLRRQMTLVYTTCMAMCGNGV